MKTTRSFHLKVFISVLVVKFSIHLNRHVFVITEAELIYLADFLPFYTLDFCDSLCSFLLSNTLLKRILLTRNEFVPSVDFFFSFRVDHF